MKGTISIVIAALNEELNIEGAIRTAISAAEQWFEDYEILVFDDASTDRTGEIAEKVARENSRVKVFHNKRPLCLGGVIKEGYKRAKMEYAIWLPGKNTTSREALDIIFSHKGKADLIIPYALNMSERPLFRRLLSRLFQKILNLTFGMNLKYFNDTVLCKTDQIKKFNIRTNSYAWQAEALIKMIKAGHSYIEVGFNDIFVKPGRKTKALKLNNIFGVTKFYFSTIWDLYFSES